MEPIKSVVSRVVKALDGKRASPVTKRETSDTEPAPPPSRGRLHHYRVVWSTTGESGLPVKAKILELQASDDDDAWNQAANALPPEALSTCVLERLP